MSKFQNTLKDLIKEGENTISALSAATGIERSYLSKIISGKRKMSFESFIAIADAVSHNAKNAPSLSKHTFPMCSAGTNSRLISTMSQATL